MDFLTDIVKEIGGEYTQLASDIVETETYVDTGSYVFNALVSGSIFGGVSGNKITAIAGETSTGKTFFSLAVVKNFLDKFDEIVKNKANKHLWEDTIDNNNHFYINETLKKSEAILRNIANTLIVWEAYGWCFFIGNGKCPK